MKKNVTIYDIAREADVSPATVSRILNGTVAVRPEKRERVLELIRQYDFHPNALARALTVTRSGIIGMIMADTVNPYYASLFSSCENEAVSRGYSVLLMCTNSKPENEIAMLRRAREMRTDAVIISGGRVDLDLQKPAFLQEISSLRESTRVIVASHSPMPGIPGIAVDHRGSMEKALQYLFRLGHRDIGFIYTGEQYYGTVERLDQMRKSLAEAGLPCREEWLIRVSNYDIISGVEGVEKLMALPRLPTALLGMNDMMSAGILRGLIAHGIRVPEDISLLGFDDTFISDITYPRLSSISYDYADFARRLVDAALDSPDTEKDREAEPDSRLIPVFLTERDSCAAPRRFS